jgi:hypothetical protein
MKANRWKAFGWDVLATLTELWYIVAPVPEGSATGMIYEHARKMRERARELRGEGTADERR